MNSENDSQFYEENVSDSAYYQRPQEPIAPPKQKKRLKFWQLFAIGLIVLILIAGTAYSIVRTIRDLNIRINRSDNGIWISIGEKRGEEKSKQPPEKESSGDKVQKNDVLRGDQKLAVSDSPRSAPNLLSGQDGALSLQEIYEKMIPSVVSIVTNNGSGTGIIMSEDGYLITNYHVIDGAYEIAAILNSDETYPAALVGGDEASDLAVLKISAEQALRPAEFGDSDQLRVGDSVVAIGDPLGTRLRGTMTDGIISAINRDLIVNDREMTLIQTNAALNNGNSGGPLINCFGQVIGINAIKLSSSYFNSSVEGLGFAIPISSAKPIIDELIENGYVSGRPAIGIGGESLPMAVRVYYRLPEGVYITYVNPASDAYAQGIAEGDIITAIDGTAIATIDQLDSVKNQYQAGQRVTLTVYTQGGFRDVSIVLMDAALTATD